jgi:hypothetical protein
MEHQLDATITVLLISKISSTCFGQTFAYLQERKTEIFTTYGIMSCWCGRQGFWALLLGTTCTVWKKLPSYRTLLLLHLVGVPYYFTYIDDARLNTNHMLQKLCNGPHFPAEFKVWQFKICPLYTRLGRPPDHPTRSQLLYQLRYPSPSSNSYTKN